MRQAVVAIAMLLMGIGCSNAGEKSVQMTRERIEQSLLKSWPEELAENLVRHRMTRSV